jgi:hypothetical protein
MDHNSDVCIISMWRLLQNVQSNGTIFRLHIYPELLTVQIQYRNHLNCFCLTWFGYTFILSCTVLCLSVCWNFLSVLAKYLICILGFCCLWLMPTSSTASSLPLEYKIFNREEVTFFVIWIECFIDCIIILSPVPLMVLRTKDVSNKQLRVSSCLICMIYVIVSDICYFMWILLGPRVRMLVLLIPYSVHWTYE